MDELNELMQLAQSVAEMEEKKDREIKRLKKEPRLGCATTAELIDEIRTRCDVDGTLGYRTIDGGRQ